MDMAKVKLSQLAQHGEVLERYGARLNFLGQRNMVRSDVLEVIDQAIAMTEKNGKAILNICAPYTSRDEITTAIRTTVEDYSKPLVPHIKRPFSETHIARNIRARQLSTVVEEDSPPPDKAEGKTNGELHPEDPLQQQAQDNMSSVPSEPTTTASSNSPALSSTTSVADGALDDPSRHPHNFPDPEFITAATLTDHTFTAGMPPLDLLVRTSGVERLSDFMLWQCHEETEIVFCNCLWPEFDLWRFLPVLLEWQWRKRREGKGQGEVGSRGRKGVRAE